MIAPARQGLSCVMSLLCLAIAFAAPARAASPGAWAELFAKASAACSRASGLSGVRPGKPVDFSDKVLVLVDGRWPQPHMNRRPAHFACLYDKRTGTAEANEAPR
jgi:hypothetical protein